MIRNLFIAAGLLMVVTVGSFVAGLTGGSPALLVLALLCAAPIGFMVLGAAMGRASVEYSITRRRVTASSQTVRGEVVNPRVARERQPLG